MVVGPVRFSCGKIKAEKLRAGRYTAKKTLIREKRRGQKDSDRGNTLLWPRFSPFRFLLR
jgi:hypothetical protein